MVEWQARQELESSNIARSADMRSEHVESMLRRIQMAIGLDDQEACDTFLMNGEGQMNC